MSSFSLFVAIAIEAFNKLGKEKELETENSNSQNQEQQEEVSFHQWPSYNTYILGFLERNH